MKDYKMKDKKKLYKAYINVVKSVACIDRNSFSSENVLKEPIIEAYSKQEVKQYLLDKYPNFFQNNKIYERESKDTAQFFYVSIYELYEYEKELISKGTWVCSYCGQIHKNKYISRPTTNNRLLGEDKLFCYSEDNYCLNKFIEKFFQNIELEDDLAYITTNSPIYIYKCTEKSTNKCYIGKTKNQPFFRWYNHLTKSKSPFGTYLRQTQLSNWSFEVICELPANTINEDVLKIESEYIVKCDSIKNGFNTLISNKDVLIEND